MLRTSFFSFSLILHALSQYPVAESSIFVKSVLMNLTVANYDSRMSDFGPRLGDDEDDDDDDTIKGYLVVVSPPFACTPLSPAPVKEILSNPTSDQANLPPNPPPANPIMKMMRNSLPLLNLLSQDNNEEDSNIANLTFPRYKFVALIQRGNCSFVQKVRMAQAANYSAVIVYDNLPDRSIFPMGHAGQNVSDINIPSVFVSYYDGIELQQFNAVGSRHRYVVCLTSDFYFPFTFYLVPFFVVVLVGILAMVGGFLLKVCLDWRRSRRNRLSRRHLKKLTERKFKKGTDPYETCAICLEDYVDGDKIRILPCAHAFHSSKCIDPWLLKNRRNCPICKRHIRIPNAPPEDPSTLEEGGAENGTASESRDEERQPLLLEEGGPSGGGNSREVESRHSASGYGSTSDEPAELTREDVPREEVSVQRADDTNNSTSLGHRLAQQWSSFTGSLQRLTRRTAPEQLQEENHTETDPEVMSTSAVELEHPQEEVAILSSSLPLNASVDGELFHSFQQRTLASGNSAAQPHIHL